MEVTRRESVPGSIRMLFEVGTVAGMSDRQLLDRFLVGRAGAPESAEIAFAALVDRHGPMVLRVCRTRLGDEHDAQDAFQATFLILARNARSIRKHDSAASWLQGVARRVAACALRASAVRRAKERKAAGRATLYAPDPDPVDFAPVVQEEVGGLPEKYRTPLVLCLLDGLTHEEAATRLGWPVGTVKTRVRRAKDQLRTRLTRRGLVPSLGAITAALAAKEASAMPASLVRETARLAMEFVTVPGALSASVSGLVKLGLGSLIMSRMKIVALVIASIGALTAGATGLARQSPGPQTQEKPAQARPDVKDTTEVPKPVAAEVSEDDLLDQLEMARLDLELHQIKVDQYKQTVVMRTTQTIETYENRINGSRSARNLGELGQYGEVKPNEDLDTAKKRIEDSLSKEVDQEKERLKQSRAAYSEMRRQLRREEQRLKELEIRAAQAGSSPDPKGRTEAERITEADQFDQIKVGAIKLELLRMDAELAKEGLKAASRKLQEMRDQMHSSQKSQGMSDREYKEALDRLDDAMDQKSKDIREFQRSYESLSRQIVQEERRLRDQAKDLPPPVQAELFRSIAGPKQVGDAKPDNDIDRRLSDVERKLDLILKALGNRDREPKK